MAFKNLLFDKGESRKKITRSEQYNRFTIQHAGYK